MQRRQGDPRRGRCKTEILYLSTLQLPFGTRIANRHRVGTCRYRSTPSATELPASTKLPSPSAIKTVTLPNGIVTAFGYDGLGRTVSVNVKHPTTAASHVVTGFEYDAEGRGIGITLLSTSKPRKSQTLRNYFDYASKD
ncbi:MAG: hypothetical protein ACRCY3_03105 [Sphingorhabdus sp.]